MGATACCVAPEGARWSAYPTEIVLTGQDISKTLSSSRKRTATSLEVSFIRAPVADVTTNTEQVVRVVEDRAQRSSVVAMRSSLQNRDGEGIELSVDGVGVSLPPPRLIRLALEGVRLVSEGVTAPTLSIEPQIVVGPLQDGNKDEVDDEEDASSDDSWIIREDDIQLYTPLPRRINPQVVTIRLGDATLLREYHRPRPAVVIDDIDEALLLLQGEEEARRVLFLFEWAHSFAALTTETRTWREIHSLVLEESAQRAELHAMWGAGLRVSMDQLRPESLSGTAPRRRRTLTSETLEAMELEMRTAIQMDYLHGLSSIFHHFGNLHMKAPQTSSIGMPSRHNRFIWHYGRETHGTLPHSATTLTPPPHDAQTHLLMHRALRRTPGGWDMCEGRR